MCLTYAICKMGILTVLVLRTFCRNKQINIYFATINHWQLARLLEAVENAIGKGNLFCSKRGYRQKKKKTNAKIEMKGIPTCCCGTGKKKIQDCKRVLLLWWKKAWNMIFSVSLLSVIIDQKFTLFRDPGNLTVWFQWAALITRMIREDHLLVRNGRQEYLRKAEQERPPRIAGMMPNPGSTTTEHDARRSEPFWSGVESRIR